MSQNILIFVVDQLNGTLFPVGPADWLYAPNLKRLAARSTRFNRGLYRLAALRTGGQARGQSLAMECAAEATYAPIVSLCSGWWKYIRCALDPEQLFYLGTNPHELTNLASHLQHKKVLHDLRDQSHALWDLDRFDVEVRESQARRWVVYEALREGGAYPWDYQPLQKASERYMRNHMDLNTLEAQKRVPKAP